MQSAVEKNKKAKDLGFYGKHLGILGGGQLGKMLIQSAANYNVLGIVLDPDSNAPCKSFCEKFINGDLNDFDTVYNFGKKVDLLTIEIENVNIEALEKLEKEGLTIHPQPSIIKTIQDKGLQKTFYKENNIPTAEFFLIDNKKELEKNKNQFPCIQKLRKAGYDGRGVLKISSEKDMDNAFDEPSVIEKIIDIKNEISIIVGRNLSGEIKVYPAIELKFHKQANLVDYLFSPASIEKGLEDKAKQIAVSIAESLKIVGLLAVEMFVAKQGEVLVNEISPRPHNSGHHTIEANITSQFEQHLRAILNLPLGETDIIMPAVMVNLLGEETSNGPVQFEGIDEVLKIKGVYIHLYGKKYTKPFRKMGHITIMDADINKAIEKAEKIKKTVRVIS